jgi:putative ABC transport system permease protein
LAVLAIGISPKLAAAPPVMDERPAALRDDAAVWSLVLRDPDYVLIDTFYGSPGGPPIEPVHPGSRLTIIDPRTPQQTTKTFAGLLTDGSAFYGMVPGEFRYPVSAGGPSVARRSG